MSTTQVVFLQKRVQALAQLVERQQAVIHLLQADIDLTESVGCAFAFDLARGCGELGFHDGLCDSTAREVLRAASERWEEAMEAK